MSSSPARTPIELDTTDRPRAKMALVLGLLAVPGSTIAWALPSGGFVIGLPLAIGAIVLGYRAQRSHTASWMTITGMVLGIICIAFMASWTVGLIGD